MNQNVGGYDRSVRVILGVIFALVGTTMLLESTIGVVPIAAGGYLLATVIVGRCPINRALGIDTSSPS